MTLNMRSRVPKNYCLKPVSMIYPCKSHKCPSFWRIKYLIF